MNKKFFGVIFALSLIGYFGFFANSYASTSFSSENIGPNSMTIKIQNAIPFEVYVVSLLKNDGIVNNTAPEYKKSSPITTDTNGNARVSFDELAPNSDYVASYKIIGTPTLLDVLYVKTLEQIKLNELNTTTSTRTTEVAPAPPAPEKEKGIVPRCNVGPIDQATGNYINACDFNYFMRLINNIIKFLLFVIATPLVALIIVYVAYLFLSAGGSAGQTEKAKHILFNVVIGYVIALSAWLIINTIMTTLKVDPEINMFMSGIEEK